MTKVKTIDDVFDIIWEKWERYVRWRGIAKKYISCDFDNYVFWNRDQAEWEDADYFEEYWENQDYWIKKYQNPNYFDKEVKKQFKNYFNEMYYSYLENNK